MTGRNGDDTVELLVRSREGDRTAFDLLYERLYEELRSVAHGQLRRFGKRETLDTTGVVHETYLRLAREEKVPWDCRAHFLAIAARAMRRTIVDYVRERSAVKRGGGTPHVTLSPELVSGPHDPETLFATDLAISKLAQFNERLSQVAECRLFGGFTEEETAQALGVSLRTVQRDWQRARAWLQQELSD